MLYSTKVLQRILPDLGIWDYGTDFAKLWQMEPLGTTQAIIVWGDTPADPQVHPVDTTSYLTPIDWGIVACSRDPHLHITVLDLRPNEHASHPAIRWLQIHRRECVPWLRRLVVQDLLSLSDLLGLRALFTGKQETLDDTVIVHPSEAIRTLPVCQMDITDDATHHAIANLVGPLLLIRNPLPENNAAGPQHRQALRQVLRAAGLIHPSSASPNKDGASNAAPKPTNLDNVRVILLDDQWSHGWAEWVSERLGLLWESARADSARKLAMHEPQCVAGNPNTGLSLWVSNTPHWVLETAKKALKGKGRDARLELRLTDSSDDSNEILLLDLRLFPSGSLDDRTFIGDLAEVANQIATRKVPPFSEVELSDVKAWALGNKSGADVPTVLTLFPRVLAQTDFSLPIVLFSSTGRRDVAARLNDYPNIFTHFSKPLLLREPRPDIAERAEQELTVAIESAFRLASARQLCRQIVLAAKRDVPVNRRASGFRHFELYLDESGKGTLSADPDAKIGEERKFLIGGLLVGYRDAHDRNSGPVAVHHCMESKGLRWWPTDLYSRYLLKDSTFDVIRDLPGAVSPPKPDDILGDFLQCLRGMPAYGVCLEYRAPAEEEDELQAHWRNDNRHRFLLSSLLELFLFDVLPEVVDGDTKISIFMATRARDSDEFRGGKATIKRLRALYGYEGDRFYLRSLNEASVLPIILEVIERRGRRNLPARLEHARGVALAYPKFAVDETADDPAIRLDAERRPVIRSRRPAWEEARHQSYIADIVAKLCRHNGRKFDPSLSYSRLFRSGVYDVLDARLDALLRAARAVEIGDRTAALLEVVNCDFQMTFAKRSAAILLLHRIAKAIQSDLTNEDLAALAQHIRFEPLSTQTSLSSQIERGNVKYYDENRGFGHIATAADDVFFHIRSWRSATLPLMDETVEFESFRKSDGKREASWVRSLV